MTGYRIALALEGPLQNNLHLCGLPPTRNAAKQHGRGDKKNSLSSKQIVAQKSILNPPQINWEKKQKNTTINLRKIRLKPLGVLHGRVVALSKDKIIGATAGGGDLQLRYDKAIKMASDGGMLFDAVADGYSR